MLMSLKCRLDFLDAGKDSIKRILPGCRESACGPPALWSGAPLQAAAGQATAVKLQTNGRANVKMMIDQAVNFAGISPSFIILRGFETVHC
jgi:hypothetical protein